MAVEESDSKEIPQSKIEILEGHTKSVIVILSLYLRCISASGVRTATSLPPRCFFPFSLSHHRSADSTARFWFVQNSSSSDSLLSVSQGPVCAHTALSSGVNYISSIDWSVGLFPPFHIEPRGIAPHGLLRRRSARLGPPRQHNRGDLHPAEPRFNREFLSRQRHSGHRRAALRLRLRALRHRVESGRNRGDFVNSRNSTQFR